jgi:hypothetical protein
MLGGTAALPALNAHKARFFHVVAEMVLKQGIGIDKYRLAFGVPHNLALLVKPFQLRPLLRVANLRDDLAEFPRKFRVFVVLLVVDFLVNDRHINDMKMIMVNIKDPELAGKLREVIKQVSHSKKWPKLKQLDENGEIKRNHNGKAILVNSYSLLQDHFCDHMKDAGFIGFERGERGSTAEHLSVLEFKAKQEAERAAAMTAVVEQKQEAADLLDAQADKKQKRLDKLDDSLTVKTKAAATVAEIDAMGKPAVFGGFSVSADEIGRLKTLAKKGVTITDNTKELKRQLKAKEGELAEVKTELAAEVKKRPSIKDHLNWWTKFMEAMKRAPQRLIAVIEEILRDPPERREPERATPERKRSAYVDR